MISYFDFKPMYTRLYSTMRNYIWELDVLEKLAALECSMFRAMPDKEDIILKADDLKKELGRYEDIDENIIKYIDQIIELASGEDELYMPLK